MLTGMRRFIDVRKDELQPGLLFFGFWFTVMLVFQVLKPLKAGMFIEALDARTELYAKLGNIAVAALLVVLFTALYNRLGSRRTIWTLCGFFIAALLAFAWIFSRGLPEPAIWTFYLFGDAWSTLWVTTFWAYLNERTTTEQAKRLYGLIGGGAVLGGLFGNLFVWQLVRPLGTPPLLLGCAAVTLLVVLFVSRTEAIAARPNSPLRSTPPPPATTAPAAAPAPNPAFEGAKLVFASRYLIAITAIVFLYELASQILDFQYKSASELVKGQADTQAFLAGVSTFTAVLSVVVQFFLVSFIVRRFGLTTALLILPAAMAISSGVFLANPVLTAAALLYISDNGLAYSLNQTARETLYVPTGDDAKYKARAFANMFVQRFGKGGAIVMMLALGALPVRYLSLIAIAVLAVWAWFARSAGRTFDDLTARPAS